MSEGTDKHSEHTHTRINGLVVGVVAVWRVGVWSGREEGFESIAYELHPSR